MRGARVDTENMYLRQKHIRRSLSGIVFEPSLGHVLGRCHVKIFALQYGDGVAQSDQEAMPISWQVEPASIAHWHDTIYILFIGIKYAV